MNKKIVIGAVAGITGLGIVGAVGTSYIVDKQARERVDAFVQQYQNVADIRYGGLSASVFTKTVVLEDIVVSPRAIMSLILPMTDVRIDRVVLSGEYDSQEIPEAFEMSATGIHLPINDGTLPPAHMMALAALGLNDEIVSDVSVKYDCDPQNRDCAMDAKYSFKDLGGVSLSIMLGNVSMDPAVMTDGDFSGITLRGAEIRYDDASLANRVMNLAAAAQDITTNELKEMIGAQLDMEANKAGGDKDTQVRQLANELKKFVNAPESISFKIAPSEPLSIVRLEKMRDPKVAIKTLNLQIKANG